MAGKVKVQNAKVKRGNEEEQEQKRTKVTKNRLASFVSFVPFCSDGRAAAPDGAPCEHGG